MVEMVLRQAIAEMERRPANLSLLVWLLGIMARMSAFEEEPLLPEIIVYAGELSTRKYLMPDDKLKTDHRERLRVERGEDYEVDYLVEKANITRDQALELIKRYGNDRETLMRHARNLE